MSLKGVDDQDLNEAQLLEEANKQTESNKAWREAINLRKSVQDVVVGNSEERIQAALKAGREDMATVKKMSTSVHPIPPKRSGFFASLFGRDTSRYQLKKSEV